MAARKINWTRRANRERKDILEYWLNRNKSATYSIKLNKLILTTIKKLSDNPTIGRKTDFRNVYVKIVRTYFIFYEFDQTQMLILAIWDGRREQTTNPLT